MRPSNAFRLASHPGVLIVLAVVALVAAVFLVDPVRCDSGFLGAIPWIGGLVSVVLAVLAGVSGCLRRWRATALGVGLGVLSAVAIGFGWAFLSFVLLVSAYFGSGGFFSFPCGV